MNTSKLATPIKRALKNKQLRDVVGALASIADTLARLHGHGVSHRDKARPSKYADGTEDSRAEVCGIAGASVLRYRMIRTDAVGGR